MGEILRPFLMRINMINVIMRQDKCETYFLQANVVNKIKVGEIMPNILIVEDDININNLLCEVLMKAGYTCEQAFSGTEAKLLLDIKEKAYTLVLLDLMLPGASGEEVLKEIRKQGRLPVIVLTAKDSIDDKIGVLTDGADDYITKPFEIREVLARIQVQLRHIE